MSFDKEPIPNENRGFRFRDILKIDLNFKRILFLLIVGWAVAFGLAALQSLFR